MSKNDRKYPYSYHPGIMDLCDPTVIRGEAIEQYARVRIARKFFPSMYPKAFVMIQDEQGNVQSVWRAALRREV
jgi:hypothetical protein